MILWLFMGRPRWAKGRDETAIEQVPLYVPVVMSGAMWEQQEGPADVNLALVEGLKDGKEGNGLERGYNEKGEGLGHEKSGVMSSVGLKVLKSVSKITCSQNLS